MADLAAHIQTPLPNFGGRYHHEHKLMYESSNIARHSDQRASPDDAPPSSRHGGDGGSGPSTTDEVTNEADDEDSSGGQADEQDEEDDAESLAPSHGYGKGKGRRPAIRIESAGDDTSPEDEETSSREAGPTSNLMGDQIGSGKKKRTYSNLSNTSLLFSEDNTGFPRPKVARTLSHSGGTGLLAYTPANEHDENAIESDDEIDLDAKLGGEQTTDVTDVDDEDYSGLNQISDDEDDIEKVEQQEESFIINDELNHTPQPDMFWADYDDTRRLSLDSIGSDTIFPLPPDDEFSRWGGTYVGNFLEREELPPSPNPVSKRKLSEGSSKRVRFDDEVHMSDSSSSSSSDETDSAFYPDLFLESDKLPPIVQQLMDMDNQSDDGYPSNASDQSFWDYVDMESRNATPHASDMSDESSSEAGSSGYETDEGDTTDDWESDIEVPASTLTPKPKSVLHRPSSAPASRAATPKPFQRTSAGPPRGVFYHNDDQPIAITDRKTKALTFYRPRATSTLGSQFNPLQYATYSSSTSTANNSPRTSIHHLNALETDADDVFTTAADIMLSGMLGTNPFSWPLGGGTVGPAEAFYPMVYVNTNGEFVADDDSFDDDDEDIEDDLNLTEFMDFGSDADETDIDQGNQTDVPATPATSTIALPGSTAGETPTPRTSLEHKHSNASAILEHLDRTGVTAFRNNQNRFRDIACLPNDPNLRASVSRPIRSGRSADTLISPLRKRSSISKRQPRSKATTRLGGRSASRMATFS